MDDKRNLLIMGLVMLNFVGVVALGYGAYTYLQSGAEQLYKVKIKADVSYTPFFGGFKVENVDVDVQEEGIGGYFKRKPLSLLRLENIIVRVTLGTYGETVCRDEVFTSFSRIGDKKSFEFECRRVPRGEYDLKVQVVHNNDVKAEFTQGVSVGLS